MYCDKYPHHLLKRKERNGSVNMPRLSAVLFFKELSHRGTWCYYLIYLPLLQSGDNLCLPVDEGGGVKSIPNSLLISISKQCDKY